MKKTFLIIFLIALAGGGYYYYHKLHPDELSTEKAQQLKVSEFSMEAQIVAIDGDTLTVKAGRVERTAIGNALIQYERKVKLAPQTIFSLRFSPEFGSVTMTPADIISKLRVGDRAVFYSTQNPNTSDAVFVASKVEMI